MRRLLGATLLLAGCSGFAGERQPPLLRDFIGLNAAASNERNAEHAAFYRPAAGLLRAYQSLKHDLGADTSKVPPLPRALNGHDWTAAYGAWRLAGWDIDVSLRFEAIPVEQWKDLEGDTRAYAQAFARQFGPSGVSQLVRSVEIGNEPGDWSDLDCRRVFRAMAEGLRAGDPALTIATCNVTTRPSSRWEKSVTTLAGSENLFDVLTIHTYAALEGWPTWQRSYPEDPQLQDYLPVVTELCAWRDAHMPGKPVWITEFGYDSSTQNPPATGRGAQWRGVTDTQQAQWIVRSLLVFSALPVERAYLFFYDDEDKPKHHGSAGLTRFSKPKPSFHAVSHLQRVLGDYRFQRVVTDQSGSLRIQEYIRGNDPARIAWAIWSPTGNERETEETLRDLPGRLLSDEIMPLAEPATAGPPPPVRENPDRTLTVTVTESPLYLFFEKTPR
jgi:serine/threonine-protein kinase ATR